MNSKIDLYLIDAGNSRLKLGICIKGEIISLSSFNSLSLLKQELEPHVPIALSSVLNPNFKEEFTKVKNPIFLINHQLQLPFKINYLSPSTIGTDRICNVAAISKINQFTPRLVIDIGTCIKFDFLNAKNEYEGGSISPGLLLRFKALNLFTSNLPLYEASNEVSLIGNSTQSAIQSGVQNGMKSEIIGLISEYKAKYTDLKVFVTGGDAHYFDLAQKNVIFADENLTLKGIIEIYLLNV